MTSCALCTASITGLVHREPFGRNDALVAVCDACRDEHPRSGRYAFGESTRSSLSDGSTLSLIGGSRRGSGGMGGAK